MADLKYTVDVDANPGIAALNRLQGQVGVTTQVFSRLKDAIAGMAVGGAVASLYNYADAIDDVAKANGVAIASVLGFGKALEYNGGRADSAANALATFSSNISEAADGSGKLQDTFGRLGVTLEDLTNLSEQDLLKKTVEGFSRVENTSLRASLSTQVFGRAIKGVDLKGFVEDYTKYTAASAGNAASIASAAQASENFSRVVGAFKTELLAALKPISDLAAGLLDIGSGFKTAIRWVVDFGLALASLWIGFRALKLGWAIIAGGASVFAAIGEAATNLMGLFRVMFNPLLRSDLLANMKLMGPLFRGIAAVAEAVFGTIKSVAAGLGLLTAGIYASWNAIKETFGWSKKAKEDSEEAAKADEAAAKAARELQAAYAKKSQEIQRTSDNFKKVNADIVNAINTENELIGKSKVYSDVVKAQEALFKRNADEIDKLRDAKEALTAEEKRAGLGNVYDAQILKIQKLTDAEAARLERAIKNQNLLQNAEQFRLYGIQNQIDKSRELQTIQDDIAKMGLSEIEKKYYDIDAAAKAAATSAIAAEEARRGAKLNPAEAKAYYDEARKGTDSLKTAQGQAYEQSRRFSTGWNKALQEYVDNATNAAMIAENLFRTATKGMEDAFVNFAKTGKLSFKDLINSMLEMLLRSQIQQSMTKLMGLGGAGSKSGGLFGGSIIPGFLASGGPASSNRAYIVGERGPELFVPSSNGTVVPNGQLSGGQAVTYNISAVDAQSFQALVARDPSFIHAVAEAGRRTLPLTRK